MTWEELRDLLLELSQDTRATNALGLDAVALNVVPVAWFISMKLTRTLNVGVYEGEDHRLVGTEQIPLAELTPAFVRERVEQAIGEQVRGMLDPAAVETFRRQLEKNARLDLDRELS